MDLDLADWLVINGIETDAELRASATQLGGDVHIPFDGGDLYLAGTTVAFLSSVSFVLPFGNDADNLVV